MKKIGVFILLLVMASFFVIAQGNGTNNTGNTGNQQPDNLDKVDEAYQCLSDLIDDKAQADLSLQEAVFSTLALGSNSKLKSVIEDSKDGNCYGQSGCTLKETAQVLLAYDRINRNTEAIESYLLDKAKTATELIWYLQIDIANHVQSSCTLTYQNSDRTITINEDMTLSGNPGSCLSISQSGFWLKVNNNCIDENFRISCDQDFVTSLLYQRSGSNTIFISPETHSAASSGTTEEKINSKCFKEGSSCDYEGTLWSALALDKTNNEVSGYLPYLSALSEENKRLFPSAFLYILTQGNDQYSQIVQAQKQEKFWQAPNSPYNKFYDSALALMSLQGTSSQELSLSKDYFLGIQTPEGCWNNNNIRDTAFVLYGGWPKGVSKESGGGITESCIAQGYNCVSSIFACSDAGGQVLDYDCDATVGVCCSVSLQLQSCQALDGILCTSSQECSGLQVNSLDGTCCLDSCIEVSQQVTECGLNGGGCHSECIEGEKQESYSCGNTGDVCCVSSGKKASSGNIWIWVIILLVLVALVVLAIIYRKKLQLWLYKFKNRKSRGGQKGEIFGRRPPPPPYRPQMIRRPMPPRRGPPRAPPRRPGQDKELDETLRKLREMSK